MAVRADAGDEGTRAGGPEPVGAVGLAELRMSRRRRVRRSGGLRRLPGAAYRRACSARGSITPKIAAPFDRDGRKGKTVDSVASQPDKAGVMEDVVWDPTARAEFLPA